MDRSLVSRELGLLLREGYAEEPADGGDKRRYNLPLSLTDKGRALAGEMDRVVRGIQTDLDRDVTPEDLAAFYRVLQIIDTRLEERT